MEVKQSFYIDGKEYGSGHPFIVAEIGINHNGDMDLAMETISAAAKAGVDAVKFQNYQTEDFIFDQKLRLRYQSQGKEVDEPQYDIFKRCELSKGQLVDLHRECSRLGVNFHSTPTSVEGIQDLLSLGCNVIKNGSDYLTNLPLIEEMAKSGQLVVLSTGMSTLSEIDDAVQVFLSTGNKQLILLHCTSSYPTPPEQIHLAKMRTLSDAFGLPVGFSDHSVGPTAAIGATILGACWIEKHFTLDRNLEGPDHWFSIDPTELEDLLKSVRDVEKMVGSSAITPTSEEAISRRDFRLSCKAKQNLEAGTIVSGKDIVFQRPGTGYAPKYEDFLVGLKLTHPIHAGELFEKRHFS